MRLSGFVAVFAFAAAAAVAQRMTAKEFLDRDDLPVQFDSQELQRLVADLSRFKGPAETEILAAIAAKDAERLYRMVRCPLCYACMHADTLTETRCGHVMHRECLKRSVKYNGDSCPQCRTSRVLRLNAPAKLKAVFQCFQGVGPLKKMLTLFDKNEWIPAKLSLRDLLLLSFEDQMANRIVAHINIVEIIILKFAAAFDPQDTDGFVFRSNNVVRLSHVWHGIDEAISSHPNDNCYEFLNSYDIYDERHSSQIRTPYEWLQHSVPLISRQRENPPPTILLHNLTPWPGTTWKKAYIARERFMNWILSSIYDLSMNIVPDGIESHILQPAETLYPADFRQLAGEWLVSLAKVLCGNLRDELRRTEPGWLSIDSSRWQRRVNYLFKIVRTLVYTTADEVSAPVKEYLNHITQLQMALELPSRSKSDVTLDVTKRYTDIAANLVRIEGTVHDLL